MNGAGIDELKRLLQTQGSLTGRIASASMHPLLPVGTMIQITAVRRELRRFDLIVFVQDGKLTCHYIHHLNRLRDAVSGERVYITKGLQNSDEDLPLTEGCILGQVEAYRIGFWTRGRLLWNALLTA